ncbi:hypothetical protein DL96DRAFT_1577243 [Flagelloscypha sp. PMI_526]|nr:hypothetical protein DL96DRAFT_1577243 [Flagelloscypha sp. PMI_526]
MSDFGQQLSALAVQSKTGLLSGAWLYPLSGIVYIVTHPALAHVITPVLLKCLALSTGITLGMFFFTYLPQVAFCALFSGPVLAWPAAALMVLGESYALILFFTKTLYLDRAQALLFDAVLVQQGHDALVERGREITKDSSTGMKKVRKAVLKPLSRFAPSSIVTYLLTLPLNSLPVVGTVIFLVYNGKRSGHRFHSRYFQLKGWGTSDQQSFVQEHRAQYAAFGATALALNLVPFIGLIFNFTNFAGAALWASALENHSASLFPEDKAVNVEIEDDSSASR